MCQSTVETSIETVMEPFDYGDVKLESGLLQQRFNLNREYLYSLSNDSLMYPFRFESLLPCPGEPFGGWEEPISRVRGHFFGHYLSACARTYATTGDEEIKAKADDLITELAKCQEINGDGYIGPIPERYLDRVEECGPNAYVWCPYYMIHKTLMGCYEMYKYAGNVQALDILKRMADYLKQRIDKLSDEQMAHMLTEEHGGMSHVLYQLYRETGDPSHLELAQRWDHHAFLDPLAANEDQLTFVHANTNLPKVYGASEAYELTGEGCYHDAVINFWHMINPNRSYATGGSNSQEHWSEPGKLRNTLVIHALEQPEEPGNQPRNHNQETCTSFNWMYVNHYLLRWTGDVKYADQYERNLYNGIISAQNPEDGQFIYFTPMAPGTRKTFGTPTQTFWCCYGTGVQAFSDLASSIYFKDAADEILYVNLYAASQATWRRNADAGGLVRIEQETNYPLQTVSEITIHLEDAQTFELALRIPWWVKDDVELSVNGQPMEGPFSPSSYYRVRRQWEHGDRIKLSMPMHWYTAPLPDAPNIAALMYGPLVMVALADGDVILNSDQKNPEAWIESSRYRRQVPGIPPDQSPCGHPRFLLHGEERDWQLWPLYTTQHEQYTMYLRWQGYSQ